MLTSRDIRRKYLDFFISKHHVEIQSASVLPKDDPTVLFTTAGMQQFVPYLMGKKYPHGDKLCDSQKCVRTNDIEEVGDNRHLTFFEMLGNWSLGSYFKQEAIAWSYEFLTEHLGIDGRDLWVTVFAGDKDVPLDVESIEIWKSVGIAEERIVKIGPEPGGKKGRGDNFWGPAGKTGPCGPSTEMYLYVGDEPLKPGQTPANDEDHFLEIWNDVFMEYNQDEKGNLAKLTQKNVDTGMGLERMTMILQKKHTVFETDVFDHIFEKIQGISGKKYPPYDGENDEKNQITRAMRVIADHTRAVTHIIADGGIPSNEGQGYVLRRLIRRMVRFGKKLGIEKPFTAQMAETHIENFEEFYPEIGERKDVILSTLNIEEENFLRTLEKGERLLDEILEKNPKEISGTEAFQLFDTYGFPLDLTKEIAGEKGVSVDEIGFEEEMKQQKERARAGKGGFFDRGNADRSAFENLEPTKFTGYEDYESKAKILFIQSRPGRDSESSGSPLSERGAGGDFVEFALDKTPFYAECGGQIADTGIIENKNGKIRVTDVQKTGNNVYIHTGEIIEGELTTGDEVISKIDAPRREQIRRHHSATHLLHAALKKVLGDQVQQQGSLVAENRTRFDFSFPRALKPKEIHDIEAVITTWVTGAYPVTVEHMDLEKAKSGGAEALFSEKYDQHVRTIRMGDQSFELCGGTHVSNTADIGAVKIIKESSVASGIRRVEMICAEASQNYIWQMSETVNEIAAKLKVPAEKIMERITTVFAEKKALEKECAELQKKLVRYESDEFFELMKEVNGVKIVCEPVPTGDAKKVGAIARELVGRGVDIAAIFTRDGSVAVATKGDISAKEILEKITAFGGGAGGGGKVFAQGAKVNLEEFRGIREVVEGVGIREEQS